MTAIGVRHTGPDAGRLVVRSLHPGAAPAVTGIHGRSTLLTRHGTHGALSVDWTVSTLDDAVPAPDPLVEALLERTEAFLHALPWRALDAYAFELVLAPPGRAVDASVRDRFRGRPRLTLVVPVPAAEQPPSPQDVVNLLLRALPTLAHEVHHFDATWQRRFGDYPGDLRKEEATAYLVGHCLLVDLATGLRERGVTMRVRTGPLLDTADADALADTFGPSGAGQLDAARRLLGAAEAATGDAAEALDPGRLETLQARCALLLSSDG